MSAIVKDSGTDCEKIGKHLKLKKIIISRTQWFQRSWGRGEGRKLGSTGELIRIDPLEFFCLFSDGI